MTDDPTPPGRTLGTLRAENTAGVVRIADRFDTDAADLWSALTDPARLARWYGEVSGELQEGGEFRVYLAGPDLESMGRVEACTPPSLLRVRTRETDESARKGRGKPFEQTVEATLTQHGAHTELVVEIRGLPLPDIAAYGVGWQLHVESLGSHLAGAARPDVATRWGELAGAYQALAARLA